MATTFESLAEAGIRSAGTAESIPFAEIEARIHRMRSEAMTAYAKAAARGLWRLTRGAGHVTLRALENAAAARAVEQLRRLDDATLVELGLRRDALSQQVFASVFGRGAEPSLAAIAGGRAAAGKPSFEAPDRRAA